MTTKEPTQVDFENSLGQVIKPGDEVVIVTSGWCHDINIAKGTYLGKRRNKVICEKEIPTTLYKLKATGDIIDKYKLMPECPRLNYKFRYGTPEYSAENRRYSEAMKEYHTKKSAIDSLFEPVKSTRKSRTTLQRNRIFKIDTSAVDLKI